MNSKRNTFVVKLISKEHASWQGSIAWVDEHKEQTFRSALELIKLIDGAVNGNIEVVSND